MGVLYKALTCSDSIVNALELPVLDKAIDIHFIHLLYPPQNEVLGGVYWFHPVRPSVRPSVRL